MVLYVLCIKISGFLNEACGNALPARRRAARATARGMALRNNLGKDQLLVRVA
ncbi:MAG: hypothetical protein JOZ19_16845 [Rubrobacter sp.]|nr:hypothetical protein [Rubrobacter sp.]